MRLPRFRIRTLMVAVGAMGAILTSERAAARFAVCLVSDNGDGQRYIVHEVIEVWAFMHVPVAIGILMIWPMIRAADPPRLPIAPPPPPE